MACSAGPDVSESGLVLALDAGDRYSFILTSVEVLVVAGGGGGGMDMGGGGGGGGVIYNSNVTVTPGSSVTVTVGAGGAGAPAGGTNGQPSSHQFTIGASNGGNSVFGSLTAIGGGAGGSSYWGYTPNNGYGAAGGSGGGASGYKQGVGSDGRGGAGTSGQGFAGGGGSNQYYSGGGGGAGGAGVSGPNKPNGGPGVLYPSMSPYYFGGGGGGASYSLSTGGDGGVGGGGGGAVGTTYGGAGLNNGSAGGGGSPGSQTNTPGGNAGANTGGGGGGGSHYNSNNKGGDGGSGIVIVRYPGPQRAIGGTVTFSGGHTIHTFTTVGSATFTPLSASNGNTILGLSDLSNTGNFGTTVNSPVYSSANGGSISFDGSNQYAEILSNGKSSIFETQTFSIESIFYRTAGGDNVLWSFDYTSHASPYYSQHLRMSGDTLHFFWNNSSIYRSINTTVSNLNQWTSVTATFTSGYQGLYVNGSLVASSTVADTITYYNQEIWIGRGNYGGSEFFGRIAYTKFYNKALTAAEISQNFNAIRSRFGI